MVTKTVVGIDYKNGNAVNMPASTSSVKVISKLAFLSLFTDAELVAIYTAAKTSAVIEVWIKKLEAALDVTLSSKSTIAGVKELEKYGLIKKGRSAIILKI